MTSDAPGTAPATPPGTITFVIWDQVTDGVAVKHDGNLAWQEGSFDSIDQYLRGLAPLGVPVILLVEEPGDGEPRALTPREEYEAAGKRLSDALGSYGRVKAATARMMQAAEDEYGEAYRGLARYEKSPGVPKDEYGEAVAGDDGKDG